MDTPHINILTNVESVLRFIYQQTKDAPDFGFTHRSGDYMIDIGTGFRPSLRVLHVMDCPSYDDCIYYDDVTDSVRDWGNIKEEALLQFLYSWHDAIKPRIAKLAYVASENFRV